MKATILLWVGLLGVAGCRTVAQPRFFPEVWPVSLRQSQAASPSAATAAPSVLVEPVILEVDHSPEETGLPQDVPTAEVLTGLLVQHLRTNGINAWRQEESLSEPGYVLTCMVSRLVYTEYPRYPRKILYAAEMACRLVDRRTHQVLWERQVEYTLDRLVLFNTMTRMPHGRSEHEEILVQKCVVPACETVAAGVAVSLNGQLKANPESSRAGDSISGG